MRDRTLAMKWAEEFVVAGNDVNALTSEFIRRGVKDTTIKDQLRRLRRQGLLSAVVDHAQSDIVVEEGKPFRPVQKERARKRVR